MVLPRRIRDVIICVALLGLPVLFLHSNLKDPASVSPIDKIILRISSPIQSIVSGISSSIHRGWRRYIYLVGVQKQNETLRRENFKLQLEVREGQRNLRRFKRYEQLLGFRASRGIETIAARVISQDSSPLMRVVRVKVDQGLGALRQGLPVVTAEGVVGKMGRVYGRYADVILAVDPKSAIDVVIQRTGGRGVMRGIDGTNRYVCGIDYLLRKEEVKLGDLVVTSGVDGIFPKDLPVGRISNVTKRTYGLYQDVEVTPSVDFSSLEEMLIIVSAPPLAGPSAQPGIEPARGFLP